MKTQTRTPNRSLLPQLAVVLVTTSCFHFGCSFSGIGSDLGEGLTGSLAERSDTIGAGLGSGLIRSIRDTMTSAQTEARLAGMIDSILTTAGLNVNETATGLRDSILGPATRDYLLSLERNIMEDLVAASAGVSENLLGDRTRRRIRAIRDELLGPYTAEFVAALRDTILGPQLREQISLLRDDLLGPETRSRIDSLLTGVTDQLQAVTREEEGFLKRNITEILWTLGAVLAALLVVGGIVVAKVRRYKKMLDVTTVQINEIPDRKLYDELTARIQSKAKEAGVEGHLRTYLEKHGLLGA